MVFFDCPPICYQDLSKAHKENALCYWNYEDPDQDLPDSPRLEEIRKTVFDKGVNKEVVILREP